MFAQFAPAFSNFIFRINFNFQHNFVSLKTKNNSVPSLSDKFESLFFDIFPSFFLFFIFLFFLKDLQHYPPIQWRIIKIKKIFYT